MRVRVVPVPARLLTVVVLALLAAAPASAARPTVFTVSFSDAAIEADYAATLTAACGVPIDVAISGKVVVHEFAGKSPLVEIDSYSFRLTATNPATGASTIVRDAGPDLIRRDRATGHLTIAVTGRSTTGTGVIGRVVFDIDTGEVLSVSGNDVGFFTDTVCGAIA
jgi:hypothetical protein